MATRGPGCIDCKFSIMIPRPGDKELIRICRRFPPTPLMVPSQHGIMINTVHPQVQAEDVCGEFQQKPLVELSH
jgi:hypothetical protein